MPEAKQYLVYCDTCYYPWATTFVTLEEAEREFKRWSEDDEDLFVLCKIIRSNREIVKL